ncbi:MAG: hypothetical protein JXR36_04120 [Bacteroidales bacterium]|nr:hypothetical protein [Bacteroidales bacterium]
MLKKMQVPSHSEEWYKFRTTGYGDFIGGTGASEIGIVLSLSHYRPTLMELFHYKVGTEIPVRTDSERMFHGRNNEAYIGKLWECYDGTTEGYVNNYNKYIEEVKKVNADDFLLYQSDDINDIINYRTDANRFLVRRNIRVPEYLYNTDYPYLFCSLDFQAIDKTPAITNIGNISAGDILPPFPIECKTIDKDAARNLDYAFPDMYIAQLNAQMLITESYYGEIAVLSGGNKFDVYGFERNDDICRYILKWNTDFWENRVLPARELLKLADENPKKKEYYIGQIQPLEPEPDDSPAYRIYLSEKHESIADKVDGDDDMYNTMIKYNEVSKQKKEIEEKETGIKNTITNWFVKNKCDRINFGDSGYIKYFLKSGGKNKQLYLNSFKPKK